MFLFSDLVFPAALKRGAAYYPWICVNANAPSRNTAAAKAYNKAKAKDKWPE